MTPVSFCSVPLSKSVPHSVQIFQSKGNVVLSQMALRSVSAYIAADLQASNPVKKRQQGCAMGCTILETMLTDISYNFSCS